MLFRSFWTGILSALSQLAAAPLARRIGLINTMVFAHLPANFFLVLVPFMPNLVLALVFLSLRAELSQCEGLEFDPPRLHQRIQ